MLMFRRDRQRKPGSAVRIPQRVRNIWLTAKERMLPWLPGVLLGMVITVPLALFFWLVFATDAFVVQAVTVVDARDTITRAAKTIVETELTRPSVSRNIFLVPTENLENKIASGVPAVRTVHIVRKLPGTVKIIVQEKQPTFLLLSSGTYYFVDKDGIAYEKASLENLPGVALSTVKNDDTSGHVTLGVAAVDASFVSFISRMESLIPEMVGAYVAEIHIPSLSAREVHFTLDNNWKILFDVTRSADQQASILREVLQSTLDARERESLEYIDLRVPQRVYYKTAAPAAS